MTTFTIAMTVLMAMIALGQLAISIAMLSPTKKRAITNWIAWKVDWFMLLLMVAVGSGGLFRFAVTESPEKWDYYMMAGSVGLLAMSYSVFLCMFLVRRIWEASWRVGRIESFLSHASNASVETSDG